MSISKQPKPKWITEWTEALRSKKYIQGDGFLCQLLDNVRHYCCLGVLCKIQNVSEAQGTTPSPIFSKDWTFVTFDGERYFPGINLLNTLGINNKASFQILIDKNDGGEPFEAIADYIDENWERFLT